MLQREEPNIFYLPMSCGNIAASALNIDCHSAQNVGGCLLIAILIDNNLRAMQYLFLPSNRLQYPTN